VQPSEGSADEQTDQNKRRLTPAEREVLLSRPLVGVLSSVSESGWIHSVPVHFLYIDGELRILGGSQDVKTRNVARTGQATLCVEVTEGSVRSYVSVAGTVAVQQPPAPEDLLALDARYGRSDFSSGWDEATYASAVMLRLRPTRWIAWVDWD
jgi:pyridoxamine 5'-phosphate oxidase-like protein